MYIILQGYMSLLLCAAPLNMVLLDLLGEWLVLVRTGPLYTYAHSKLIFVSPFLLVRVFTHAFSIFPMGTAWLGCPSLNIWGSWLYIAWDSGSLGDAHYYRPANICSILSTRNTYNAYLILSD
jgi:hypothetical protein